MLSKSQIAEAIVGKLTGYSKRGKLKNSVKTQLTDPKSKVFKAVAKNKG